MEFPGREACNSTVSATRLFLFVGLTGIATFAIGRRPSRELVARLIDRLDDLETVSNGSTTTITSGARTHRCLSTVR